MSKKTLAKCLIGLGTLLAVFGILCFLGVAIKGQSGSVTIDGPTMFTCMFGGTYFTSFASETSATAIGAYKGLTALFVFALIAALVVIGFVALLLTKKISGKKIIIIAAVASVLLLVAVILSFCTKAIILDQDIADMLAEASGPVPQEYIDQIRNQFNSMYKLGGAPISYSILGIISILSLVTGSILYSKEQ